MGKTFLHITSVIEPGMLHVIKSWQSIDSDQCRRQCPVIFFKINVCRPRYRKRRNKMHLYFFLYGPVPNQLWPRIGPQPSSWEPLFYSIRLSWSTECLWELETLLAVNNTFIGGRTWKETQCNMSTHPVHFEQIHLSNLHLLIRILQLLLMLMV